uniref:TSA: Wollemia nobilis Ref_Wollemi_Transcript_10933_1459 transcribed RNA sequence n=1 Tax=Wollemia nobilis TaxID=56998 RepID=A0A0C9QT54_9CONI
MEDEEWICETCTFVNEPTDFDVCTMCGSSRPHHNITDIRSRRVRNRQQEISAPTGGSALHHVPRIVASALAGTLHALFALVGAFTGAIGGALGCQAIGINILFGSVLGSIVGVVLCVEVLEAYWASWFSERSGLTSSSSMVDIFEDLLNGRFVREQVNIADMSYENMYDIFGEGGTKGLSGACLEKLPRHCITKENKNDSSGDNISCTICLQDLQQGEVARSLPLCHHIFHLSCVDKWLIRHGSCPVCRQDI